MTHEKTPFRRSFTPFRGLYDPCPPLLKKTYVVPPNLFIGFQPPDFPQFSAIDALKTGTLWTPFYDYYDNPYKK
ncbi:spore coat associated protein CotJA [Jeotgalibacillus proteolyticus]|uniref:Spore coat protein CotJA n=1 Tax=Jeotgalibacillus proteolyticus TaxID=2082395 RepID=A0A2S5GCZ6_9BACL|nr:spore coat associated protein CotJA [Jeotgalibacillus proteolyticus]PPA70791.1 spore coat protein CotJA [Jeotgalibacillus proteolyticus]